MAIQYKPRLIKKPQTDLVYLMTCKKEKAKELVKWLNQKNIAAALSGAETNEEMEDVLDTETYVVSEIEIRPPTDFSKVKTAVDAWSG